MEGWKSNPQHNIPQMRQRSQAQRRKRMRPQIRHPWQRGPALGRQVPIISGFEDQQGLTLGTLKNQQGLTLVL